MMKALKMEALTKLTDTEEDECCICGADMDEDLAFEEGRVIHICGGADYVTLEREHVDFRGHPTKDPSGCLGWWPVGHVKCWKKVQKRFDRNE